MSKYQLLSALTRSPSSERSLAGVYHASAGISSSPFVEDHVDQIRAYASLDRSPCHLTGRQTGCCCRRCRRCCLQSWTFLSNVSTGLSTTREDRKSGLARSQAGGIRKAHSPAFGTSHCVLWVAESLPSAFPPSLRTVHHTVDHTGIVFEAFVLGLLFFLHASRQSGQRSRRGLWARRTDAVGVEDDLPGRPHALRVEHEAQTQILVVLPRPAEPDEHRT